MSAKLLNSLIKQIEQLTPEEQRRLATFATQMASRGQAARRGLKWRDVRGLLAYPAAGEDAQLWVSRTRREGDAHRNVA